MDNLARCLRYYVADRLSNDPGWKNVTVSAAAQATNATGNVINDIQFLFIILILYFQYYTY